MELTTGETLRNSKTTKILRAEPLVLHILEATLGGTLRFVEDVMDCSAKMPFKMSLAYSTRRASPALSPALAKALALGWNTFPLEMTRSLNPLRDAKSVLNLRVMLLRHKPDIIHCHSSKAGGVGRLAILGLSNPPKVVYTPNALAIHLGSKYVIAERMLSPWTDRFAAVSEGECEEIICHDLASRRKINLVAPAINTMHFAPLERSAARRSLGVLDDAPVIIGIGRMVPQKDPQGFVRVAHRLLRKFPRLRAFWVGDGELRSQVENTIADLGLTSQVFVSGWQDDVRQYIAASNLLLSTSRYESFGYMVAEALAMERAVVATRVNGTTDILKGDLKLCLYSAGDYDEAARLCEDVLRDYAFAKHLGRIGREAICRRFSLTQMQKSLQDCYECVLA
jgi:glycosyltransferase involved in cell wall biosynthesis